MFEELFISKFERSELLGHLAHEGVVARAESERCTELVLTEFMCDLAQFRLPHGAEIMDFAFSFCGVIVQITHCALHEIVARPHHAVHLPPQPGLIQEVPKSSDVMHAEGDGRLVAWRSGQICPTILAVPRGMGQ